MARPGLLTHRKFARLILEMRKRGIGEDAQALGHLEFIFISCSNAAESYIGTPDDVESIARYTPLDGQLCESLLSAGFLEKREDNMLYLHDLEENATDSARKRIWRRKESKAKTTADNGGQRRTTADFDPPSSPLHTSSLKDIPASSEAAPSKKRSAPKYTTEFEEFWRMYPRKKEKPKAFDEWKRMERGDQLEAMKGLPGWIAQNHDRSQPQFTIYPERFLKRRLWEDEGDPEPIDTSVLDVPEPPQWYRVVWFDGGDAQKSANIVREDWVKWRKARNLAEGRQEDDELPPTFEKHLAYWQMRRDMVPELKRRGKTTHELNGELDALTPKFNAYWLTHNRYDREEWLAFWKEE